MQITANAYVVDV